MVIGLLTFMLGLCASYFLITLIYKKISLVKLLIGTFTIYLCLIAIVGYWMSILGISLSTQNFLVFFLIISLVFLYLKTKNNQFKLKINDRKQILGVSIIFSVGMVLNTWFAYPSFFPVSYGDGARHIAFINQIVEEEVALWMSGFHLNLAMLAKFFNIEPIKFIVLFMALITVLTASVIYIIASEKRSKMLCLTSGFYILFSLHLHTAGGPSGFYAQAFAHFLIVMFVWFLMDYLKNFDYKILSILILIESTLLLTYFKYGPILMLLFVLSIMFSNISTKLKIIYIFLFSIICSFIVMPLAPNMIGFSIDVALAAGGIEPIQQTAPWTYCIRTTLDSIPGTFNIMVFLFVLPGVIRSIIRQEDRVFLLWMAVVISQLILTYLAFGYHSYNHHKMYYALVLPCAVFASRSMEFYLDAILRIGKLKYIYAENVSNLKILFVIAFLLCSVFYGAVAYHLNMYKGHITPDQYDVVMWTKNTLPAGNLSIIATNVFAIEWFSILSGHRLNIMDDFYGWNKSVDDGEIVVMLEIDKVNNSHRLNIMDDFYGWNKSVDDGEIVVMLEIDKVNVTLDGFEVLYKKGYVYVLRKTDKQTIVVEGISVN